MKKLITLSAVALFASQISAQTADPFEMKNPAAATRTTPTARNPAATQGLVVSREKAPDTTPATGNAGPANSPQPPKPQSINLNSSRSNIYREKAEPSNGSANGPQPPKPQSSNLNSSRSNTFREMTPSTKPTSGSALVDPQMPGK